MLEALPVEVMTSGCGLDKVLFCFSDSLYWSNERKRIPGTAEPLTFIFRSIYFDAPLFQFKGF